MTLKSNFELMADYNQLMNKKIYETVSTLGSSERAENRGAFFGSIQDGILISADLSSLVGTSEYEVLLLRCE